MPERSKGRVERHHPPKPRCEVSCRGLRGTAVLKTQCYERSPWGTTQHPVVYMPSTHMERCTWWLLESTTLMGTKWIPNQINNQSKGPKKKRDFHTERSLWEGPQQGPKSSSVLSRGPVVISEPAARASAKDRDEPEVINLPEVRPGTSLMRVSYADILLQRAGTASLPAVREDT
jgi:hypothetical protein